MFSLNSFDKRSAEKEYLDMPDIAENDVLESFRFIRFVNRYGGGHKTIQIALAKVLRSWPKDRIVEVMDAGCGMGDMAMAISDWGRDNRFLIRYRGIDKNNLIVKLAKERTKKQGIEYEVGDLFDQNLPEVDVIIASMVFHHLGKEEVDRALANLLSKSRHALIINDLTRSFALYSVCYLLTRFVKNKASRVDALLSVKKGFRPEKMRAHLDKLNVGGIVKEQFCGRLSVIVFKK